jgi:hypothetical protein
MAGIAPDEDWLCGEPWDGEGDWECGASRTIGAAAVSDAVSLREAAAGRTSELSCGDETGVVTISASGSAGDAVPGLFFAAADCVAGLPAGGLKLLKVELAAESDAALAGVWMDAWADLRPME